MGCCCSSPSQPAERVYFEDVERGTTTNACAGRQVGSSTRSLPVEAPTHDRESEARTSAQESGDISVPPPAYSLHDESSTQSHRVPTLPKSPVPNSTTLVTPQELQSTTSPDLVDFSEHNRCRACSRRLATGPGSSAHNLDEPQCTCAAAGGDGSAHAEDTTGIEPDNPRCNCGQPSRCLIMGKSSDKRFFYRCATGRCWFFQWQ